jgi:TPR repeat protein
MNTKLILLGLVFLFSYGFRIPAADVDIEKLKKDAEKGDATAQINLGLYYYNGNGVSQDYQEALKWYRKAADQGFAIAQFTLGMMYFEGHGVAQDYAEAYGWLNIGSIGGNENSIELRNQVLKKMTPDQIAEGQKKAKEYLLRIEKLKKEKVGKQSNSSLSLPNQNSESSSKQ